jgi:hypothetical protein
MSGAPKSPAQQVLTEVQGPRLSEGEVVHVTPAPATAVELEKRAQDAEYMARCYCEEKEEAEGKLDELRARFAWPLLPHHVVLPMDPEIVLSLAADVEKGGRVEIAHELRKAVADHAKPSTQEVPHQALEPVERCVKCGAPRGSDHDNACPTGSWKVLESQCQPEDERESTEEATAKLRRLTDWQAEDPDLWQQLPPHTIGAKLQTELRKLHEAIQVADEEEAVGLVSQAFKSLDATTQSEQSHTEEGS